MTKKASKKDVSGLYLKLLEFPESLLNNPFAKYLSSIRVVVLLIIAIVVGGIISFATLPRELNPEVEIPIVSVVTTYPGASSLTVEEHVTKEIEDEVLGISNIDSVTSQSSDSVSVVSVQFVSTVSPNEALSLVKEKVDLVTAQLPEEANDPLVQKLDFNDQPVWSVALVSDEDRLSLSRISEKLVDNLENNSKIRKVTVSGKEEEEVFIEFDSDTLSTFGITPTQVVNIIKSNNINIPSGSVSVNNRNYALTVNNEFGGLEDVRNIIISGPNGSFRLSEIASVYLRAKDTYSFSHFVSKDGVRKTSVVLNVFKANEVGTTTAVSEARKILETEISKYPGVSMVDVVDYAKDTKEQFSELQSNFVNSILLIFLSLTVFLGFRQALVAASSIPLVLLCTFIAMNLFGMSLNFLSLFSLLLALGLVGDDAIVIVQAVSQYGRKFSPLKAGMLVFRDYFLPIWTGTLTVVWAFVPLLLATGIIGEFIKPIPIVTASTLISSTFIATFVNLPINISIMQFSWTRRFRVLLLFVLYVVLASLVYFVSGASSSSVLSIVIFTILYLVGISYLGGFRDKLTGYSHKFFGSGREHGFFDLNYFIKKYSSLVSYILVKRRRRFAVYGVSLGLFVVGIVFLATGLLKNEFFPKTDEDILYIDVEAASGENEFFVDSVMSDVENKLVKIDEVEQVFSVIGGSVQTFGASLSSSNLGYLTVILVPSEKRERTSIEISQEIRDSFYDERRASVRVVEVSGGPPAGADLQVNIKGDDLVVLEKISDDFSSKISGIKGALNVSSSLKPSTGQINISLNQKELSERNLSAAQVGMFIRSTVSGVSAGDLDVNYKDFDISVSLNEAQKTISYLKSLRLPGEFGSYSLSEISEFHLENNPIFIERVDGQRVVRVTAAASGVSPQMLLADFKKSISDYELPEGYSWDVGGANEENNRSVASIFQAMIISFILIIVTMVAKLGSFRKSAIVLVVIPLAVTGVFINFTLFGIPLSFPALIGVLALFGIVMNNAIMLMEKFNQNLEAGFDFLTSIKEACSSRIEPIFLSSFTSILGLLPITISDPLWRGLGGAIVAGLSVSGIMVLFVLPALLVDVFEGDFKNVKK